jgi:hypothetical protein
MAAIANLMLLFKSGDHRLLLKTFTAAVAVCLTRF